MRTLVVDCSAFGSLKTDVSRALALFEPVVACIEALATKIEVLAPGLCAVPTRGPSRYFGGDAALAKHVAMLVKDALRDCATSIGDAAAGGVTACQSVSVGIADGLFAAKLAAHSNQIVETSRTKDFLASQPIDALGQPNLVDLLKRLGIRTLGDFADIPRADIVGRFGAVGNNAHRLASGEEEEQFHPRQGIDDLSVEYQCEEPLQSLDMASFAMKSLADRLHANLGEQGLACNRLVIEAHMTNGEVLARIWRHDGRLSAVSIADRLRWQVESCLKRNTHPAFGGAPEGIGRLVLIPEGVMPDNGRQLGFWGGDIDADERAAQALVRVQGLVGEEGVVTAALKGGRTYPERVHFMAWGSATDESMQLDRPWPGSFPAPHPATVYKRRKKIEVKDGEGCEVVVDARGAISAAPEVMTLDGKQQTIAAWGGPWLIDQRWWSKARSVRCACLQLVTKDQVAYLVLRESKTWWLEAKYD